MLFIRILILMGLLGVCIQDLKSRFVYWIFFPVLIVLFIVSAYINHKTFNELWPPILLNLGFLSLQLLIITCWFSAKAKRWINIMVNLLGWGDILFLVSISFYLSFINFLFFHIASLLFSLTAWGIWQLFTSKKSKQVPLAGLQALILIFFLSADWWIYNFDATNDNWLSHFLIR